MQIFTDSDYKLFKSIASLSQKSLKHTMHEFLKKKYGGNVSATKDWIMAKGTIPVALVAHMDTVFDKEPTEIYYDKVQGCMWSPQGLGADDRAGVFAILKILQTGLRPTVIFTTDEERGCLGSDQLIKDMPDIPKGLDLRYIIQLDRRGTCDCVFYDCDNPIFEKYVESFGFITNFGSFTDISVICPCWGLAGVNLSVGYEDEHNKIETLHTAPLMRTIENVKAMLKEKDIPFFDYIPSKYSWWGSKMLAPYEDDDYLFDDYLGLKCDCCGKTFSDLELIDAKGKDSSHKRFCGECAADHVKWCINCGEAYEVNPDTDDDGLDLCARCRDTYDSATYVKGANF